MQQTVDTYLDSNLPGQILPFDELGFSPPQISRITAALEKQSGLIIVAGLPFSGKTTTVQNLARLIQTSPHESRSIVEVAEPIEFFDSQRRQISLPEERNHFSTEARLAVWKSLSQTVSDVIVWDDLYGQPDLIAACGKAAAGHLVIAGMSCNDSLESAFEKLREACKWTGDFQYPVMVIFQRLEFRTAQPITLSAKIGSL